MKKKSQFRSTMKLCPVASLRNAENLPLAASLAYFGITKIRTAVCCPDFAISLSL
ncbi:MAG: hypothetical protein V8R43_05090 [Dorea sp.]|nr:hypothetical protein [uncultured Dorea sp.]